MEVGLDGYESAGAVFQVWKVYAFVISITYFVLIYDWLANLPKEWSMVIRPASGSNTGSSRFLSLKPIFLASRYITLGWSTFVVATWASASSHNNVCSWFKYYPYGYSVAFLPAHLLMIMRIHSIYGRPTKMLYGLLGLAVVDFAIQMGVNHLATSVILRSADPNFAICFTYPTTAVFSLVFISPTIFHHILLVLTLWKSVKQLRTSKSFGITPILQVIQRDHILYTLAICLTNFTNLVLVLQPHSWPYKLIMQLPALMFTQIFLSRIVFSLKATQLKVTGKSSTFGSGALESGTAGNSSDQQQKKSGGTGGTGSTLVDSQNGTGSKEYKSEKGSKTSASSMRKTSQSYGVASVPQSETDGAAAYQSHRRGSSATLGPHTANASAGEYRFPAHNSIQEVDNTRPLPTTQLPPFSSMPLRYQGYRQQQQQAAQAQRGFPSPGRNRRPSRDTDEVGVHQFLEFDDSRPTTTERTEPTDAQIIEIKAALASTPPGESSSTTSSGDPAQGHGHARTGSSETNSSNGTHGNYPRSAIPVHAAEHSDFSTVDSYQTAKRDL